MINVFFLEDYQERKKGTKEILKYEKGDQAFIEREKAADLITDGIVEAFTTHADRIDIKSEEPEKPKRKKIKKETAVSKRVQKREKAVNE